MHTLPQNVPLIRGLMKLIYGDLTQLNLGVTIVSRFDTLLDDEYLLGDSFARHNDYLHLSSRGIRTLARLFKDGIFSKTLFRNKQHSKRLLSVVVKEARGLNVLRNDGIIHQRIIQVLS